VQGEREETRCEGAALQERVTELEDNGEEREREREGAGGVAAEGGRDDLEVGKLGACSETAGFRVRFFLC
jgi:hypothetical protein